MAAAARLYARCRGDIGSTHPTCLISLPPWLNNHFLLLVKGRETGRGKCTQHAARLLTALHPPLQPPPACLPGSTILFWGHLAQFNLPS